MLCYYGAQWSNTFISPWATIWLLFHSSIVLPIIAGLTPLLHQWLVHNMVEYQSQDRNAFYSDH